MNSNLVTKYLYQYVEHLSSLGSQKERRPDFSTGFVWVKVSQMIFVFFSYAFQFLKVKADLDVSNQNKGKKITPASGRLFSKCYTHTVICRHSNCCLFVFIKDISLNP